MHTHLDLRAVERKAWRSVHSDGLLDLLFGWLMLVGWLRDVTGAAPLTLLQFAGVLIVWLGKRHITLPRMGIVEFGDRRRTRRRRMVLLLAVTVAVMAGFYLVSATEAAPWSDGRVNLVNLGVTAVILLAFLGLGWLMELPRMFLIGLVFAGTNFLRGYTDAPLVFLVAGLVVTIPGLILLVTFVRRYPVAHGGEEST